MLGHHLNVGTLAGLPVRGPAPQSLSLGQGSTFGPRVPGSHRRAQRGIQESPPSEPSPPQAPMRGVLGFGTPCCDQAIRDELVAARMIVAILSYTHIYIYIYIYTHTHLCIYTHIHYRRAYIQIDVDVCMYACMYTHTVQLQVPHIRNYMCVATFRLRLSMLYQ